MNVVTIGGGTGSYHLLNGLKKYPDLNLTAIVSMMDDGGSSGKLREDYGIQAPGDIRRALLALSEDAEPLSMLMDYRFPPAGGFLDGHSLGNIIIYAMSSMQSEGDNYEKIAKWLKVKGRVIPVTTSNSRLHAILENGETIAGETNIDIPKHDPNLKISQVYLDPNASAHPSALKAIDRADYIILGPGDLYTSTIPNLLVDGIPEAIKKSWATVIYVANLMTKHGETDNMDLKDFVNEISVYLGVISIGHVVVNNTTFKRNSLQRYAQKNSFPVEVPFYAETTLGVTLTEADLASKGRLIRHDPNKLGGTLYKIMKEYEPIRSSKEFIQDMLC